MPEARLFLGGRVSLYAGDCLRVLDELDENSVDSVCCDPPYHLASIVKRFGADGSAPATGGVYNRAASGFMGKLWDGGDVAFRVDTWRKVLRVLKPGGYILAFASTRGFGRMSVAIEDAGFVTHPLIAWVFASGFPKATRIKADGYDGFRYGGQALKPAIEPIYMGQKPFSEPTGTANILRWGAGAVNIDGCRIEGTKPQVTQGVNSNATSFNVTRERRISGAPNEGRWPANLIHDGSDEVLAAFPDAPGQQQDIDPTAPSNKTGVVYGQMNLLGEKTADARYQDRGATNFAALPGLRRNDAGSAARFFYSSKANADDRLGSKHPTVKPLDLMQYLCRLVTPPCGTILDPFAGTGTTGEAAFREGFKAILIEREAEYQADIARRMELAETPTKRAAVAKSKNNLAGAEGTPLFGDDAA